MPSQARQMTALKIHNESQNTRHQANHRYKNSDIEQIGLTKTDLILNKLETAQMVTSHNKLAKKLPMNN